MRRDAKLNDSKEIIIVPGVTHVDLYDQMDKIPFDGFANSLSPRFADGDKFQFDGLIK